MLVVGVLVLAGALAVALAAFGWRVRDEVGADWFAGLMATNAAWVAVDLVRLLPLGRGTALVVERADVAAATVVPVLWFSFVLAYTGRERLLDRRGLVVLWAVPALVLVTLVLSPLGELYFADVAFTSSPNGVGLQTSPGPIAYLNLGYFAVLLAVGLWLLVRMARDHDGLFSRQAFWLLAGTLAPVTLLTSGFVVAVPNEFPLITLGFSVLGLAYARGLFSHRLLDFSPAARRIGLPEAFDDLDEGVILVDADRDVVMVNDRACRLLECQRDAVLGEPLERIAGQLARLDLDGSVQDVGVGGRTLSVSTSTVHDSQARRTGHALVVRDVTETRRRKQRLEVLNRVFRHNIRNKMNVVVGPTAVLADRLEGADADVAGTALAAGEDVVELSETVREVESMMTRPVATTTLDLATFVRNVVASVRETEPLSVETTVPDDAAVRTDPNILSVVLEHVVENAVTHGSTAHDADGSSPADAGADAASTVGITVELATGGCLLSVTDRGPGVPKRELDVLRAGVETDLAHASGLGLWAIHWGMSRLDGAVRFENTADGARVSLWVPDLDREDVAPPPTDAAVAGEWFGRTDASAVDDWSPREAFPHRPSG